MNNKIIELNNVNKIYKTKVEEIHVLKDVNLSFGKGDFASIQGKSGSGKTTLLNILGLLDIPTNGELKIDGNVMIPALINKKRDKKEIREKAEELLGLVGLANRATHKPLELSGGEKQRVAIARSMINDPEIILADEPTGNLDTETSDVINGLFKKINKEKEQSIIIVTHSMELANLATYKYKIEKGRFTAI